MGETAMLAPTSDERRTATIAIPQWRIEQVLGPPLRGAKSAPLKHDEPSNIPLMQPLDVGSTDSQDSMRCPMLQLPQDVTIIPTQTSVTSMQKGVWLSPNHIEFASWGHKWTQWESVYINNFDGFQAVRTGLDTVENVKRGYNWEPQSGAPNHPTALRPMDVVVRVTSKHSLDVDGQELEGPPRRVAPLVDCDDLLLYVIELVPPETRRSPGGINIYDKHGLLVAYSITSDMIARYQFVDMNGYLLATAESPGLFQNVSYLELPRDPAKGNVLSYGIHFESGHYADASRLLSPNYRWIITAAVQMRAIHDAHGPWSYLQFSHHTTHWAAITIYWILAGLGLLVTLFAFYSSYLCVYPTHASRKVFGQ